MSLIVAAGCRHGGWAAQPAGGLFKSLNLPFEGAADANEVLAQTIPQYVELLCLGPDCSRCPGTLFGNKGGHCRLQRNSRGHGNRHGNRHGHRRRWRRRLLRCLCRRRLLRCLGRRCLCRHDAGWRLLAHRLHWRSRRRDGYERSLPGSRLVLGASYGPVGVACGFMGRGVGRRIGSNVGGGFACPAFGWTCED